MSALPLATPQRCVGFGVAVCALHGSEVTVVVEGWRKRLNLLARVSTLQGFVQCSSALSGFLLVRVLDKRQFATYAIATSLQTILDVLTDSGIGSGVMMVGGRIWHRREALSRLISTAFKVRLWLAWFAVPVGAIPATALFRQHDIAWTESSLITLTVVLALWGMLTTNLYAMPLRLYGRYIAMQKLELFAALVRLALLSALSIVYLNASVAVLATTIGISLQAVLVRRKAAAIVTQDAPIDKSYRKELLALMRKQVLWVWFFAFQGQITIWLISIFGTTEKVAEVGALGRLAVVFAVFANVVSGVVVPTFARCSEIGRLARLFAVVLIGYGVFAGVLMASSLVWPEQFLRILGARYAGLASDLPWLVAGSVLGSYNGIVYALAAARGWIWHLWLIPPVIVSIQILLLPLLDLSSVKGVLIFGFSSVVPIVIGTSYMMSRGLWRSWKTGMIAPRAE